MLSPGFCVQQCSGNDGTFKVSDNQSRPLDQRFTQSSDRVLPEWIVAHFGSCAPSLLHRILCRSTADHRQSTRDQLRCDARNSGIQSNTIRPHREVLPDGPACFCRLRQASGIELQIGVIGHWSASISKILRNDCKPSPKLAGKINEFRYIDKTNLSDNLILFFILIMTGRRRAAASSNSRSPA